MWFAYALTAGGTGRAATEVREGFNAAVGELQTTAARLASLTEHTAYSRQLQTIAATQTELVAQARMCLENAFTGRAAGLRAIGAFEDQFDASRNADPRPVRAAETPPGRLAPGRPSRSSGPAASR